MSRETCCCCFDDILPCNIGLCPADHIICKSCITSGVISAIDDGIVFKCPDTSMCQHAISDEVLYECVTDTRMVGAYLKICTAIAIVNIPNLHHCRNCDYAMIIEGDMQNFYCEICQQDYCVHCKDNIHIGACTNAIDLATEQQIADVAIRCCGYPPMIKLDACNHLRCPCGAQWCWYCKGIYGSRGNSTNMATCRNACPLMDNPRANDIHLTDVQIQTITTTEQQRTQHIRNENIRMHDARLETQRLETQREATQLRVALAETQRIALAETQRMAMAEIERIAVAETQRIALVRYNIKKRARHQQKIQQQKNDEIEKEKCDAYQHRVDTYNTQLQKMAIINAALQKFLISE